MTEAPGVPERTASGRVRLDISVDVNGFARVYCAPEETAQHCPAGGTVCPGHSAEEEPWTCGDVPCWCYEPTCRPGAGLTEAEARAAWGDR